MSKPVSAAQIIADNFFYITSDNLNSVRSRLYGYAFDGDNFYIRDCKGRLLPDNCCGAYVNVVVDDPCIWIQQDPFNSFGVYYFVRNGFFAISNNFVTLAENLGPSFGLTLNPEYVSFLVQHKSGLTYSDTVLSEIQALPPDSQLVIDMPNKSIALIGNVPQEHYIPIDSEEAFILLDQWHGKWNSLLRQLVKWDQNVEITLSGGIDSRAAFTISRDPDINYEDVEFYTREGDFHTYKEDREIASQIAAAYGFALNTRKFAQDVASLSLADNYLLSVLVYAGSYTLYRGSNAYYKRPIFSLGGYGGELIRDYIKVDVDEYFNRVDLLPVPNKEFAAKRMAFKKKLKQQLARYKNEEISDGQLLWNKGVNSFHFGRHAALEYLLNCYFIEPLMDPMLSQIKQRSKICNDRNLLAAIIIGRYLPELVGLKFDSGHAFSDSVIAMADGLNSRYPRRNFDRSISLYSMQWPEKMPDISLKELSLFLRRENASQNDHGADIINVFGQAYYDALGSWCAVATRKKYLLRMLEQVLWIARKTGARISAELK